MSNKIHFFVHELMLDRDLDAKQNLREFLLFENKFNYYLKYNLYLIDSEPKGIGQPIPFTPSAFKDYLESVNYLSDSILETVKNSKCMVRKIVPINGEYKFINVITICAVEVS